MLKFATINPTTLDDFPEVEPMLGIAHALPRLGHVYRVHRGCGNIVCLAPGYSRDEHNRVSFDAVPLGAKFQVEMPTKNFRTKYGIGVNDIIELYFDEVGSAFFLTENATTIELRGCIDQTQLRLVHTPSTTH